MGDNEERAGRETVRGDGAGCNGPAEDAGDAVRATADGFGFARVAPYGQLILAQAGSFGKSRAGGKAAGRRP